VLESASAATDLDLISCTRAIPDTRMRRGVCFLAWYLLLVAQLGILRGRQSVRELERSLLLTEKASPMQDVTTPCSLTSVLGLEPRRPPSDSSFCYFVHQVDLAALCIARRDWMIVQIPGGTADLDQLVCDGKTLRGSIVPTAGGSSVFIAQVTL
jgi:hypothetical protein